MPTTAARTALIEPFYVMELVKEAQELAAAGRSVIHLSIGEPDFTAPEPVRRAAIETIERGETQYTAALGLPALRNCISAWYASRFNCDVPPERIVVTAGASGALLLACAALLDHDAELLMPDPSYPCNRHFATAFGGRAQLVPCGPEQRFQLTAADIELHWNDKTRGALVASPSNPTGTSIDPEVLAQLITAVQARHGFVVSDEIYQGLSYDARPSTALQISDRAVVINSFSKYFSMTGWRLGWLVAPKDFIAQIGKVIEARPDLVLLAFGMNDSAGRPAAQYQANIRGMVDAVRKALPDAEFILVATMLGNKDWTVLHQDLFPQYRDALAKLCGPGVALADMTSIWADMFKHKEDWDVTGNGVNHPNDFGHRLYAQVLSALLIPEQK